MHVECQRSQEAFMDFTVTLSDEEWDEVKGGWRCVALEIPGIEVSALYVDGKLVDPAQYNANLQLRLIRWSGSNHPATASLHLKVAAPLSTQELTVRWKKLAILLPVIGGFAAAIITAYLHSAQGESTAADRASIKVYAKSNDFLATGGPLQFDKLLLGTKREAWFVGTTFYISVDAHRELIRKKLTDGVDLNFLIFDPYGAHAPDVARMLDIGANELSDQCLLGIRTMIGLVDASRAGRLPGRLNVRLIDDTVYSRLYLFDPKAPSGSIYFIPQVNQSNSQLLPGFLGMNSQAGFAGAYFDGVLRTWNSANAQSLDSWRTSHPEIH